MEEEEKMTTIGLRYSFKGAFNNANDVLGEIEKVTAESTEIDDDTRYECMNDLGVIKSCLSLYHDVILGILKGDVSHDDAREFLCLEGDALVDAKYDASVVTIKDT